MGNLIAHLRRNLVALLALFVALGGTGYAALHLPRNSVGSAQVRNGSLSTADLSRKARVALKGRRGVPGPAGATGPTGPAGAVDASSFYDKAASDARFLGLGAKAADADTLDGHDSSAFETTVSFEGTRATGAGAVILSGTTPKGGSVLAGCSSGIPSLKLSTGLPTNPNGTDAAMQGEVSGATAPVVDAVKAMAGSTSMGTITAATSTDKIHATYLVIRDDGSVPGTSVKRTVVEVEVWIFGTGAAGPCQYFGKQRTQTEDYLVSG